MLSWERFEEVVCCMGENPTTEEICEALEADGYWPPGWPVARKFGHIRWRARRIDDADGLPLVLLHDWVCKLGPQQLTVEHSRDLLRAIDDPDWQTLEAIRLRLLAAGLLDRDWPELRQVQWLETVLGTEDLDPDPAFDGDADWRLPLVVCVWSSLETLEAEPVYKRRDRLTEADVARVRAHFATWRAEARSLVRKLDARLERRKRYRLRHPLPKRQSAE